MKLVFKARKREATSSLSSSLVAVQVRMDYKMSTIFHNFFSDSSPAHLFDLAVLHPF